MNPKAEKKLNDAIVDIWAVLDSLFEIFREMDELGDLMKEARRDLYDAIKDFEGLEIETHEGEEETE